MTEAQRLYGDFCRWLDRQEARGDLPFAFASPAYRVRRTLWMCANNPPSASLRRFLAEEVEKLEEALGRQQ